MKENLISVAKILNFHGIKGEAKLGFSKGAEARIEKLKKVFVKKNCVGADKSTAKTQLNTNKTYSGGEMLELNVSSVRFHKQFAIVKFKEFTTVNDVEAYKGCDLYVPKSEIEENLDNDEYLISDLIGMEVFDEDGACLGNVSAIGENLANDIIEVTDNNNKKHLVPFVKAIVPVVDLKNHRIVVNNIEGLIN